MLLILYKEHIMGKVTDGWKGEIAIGVLKISNLRYADDTVLLTSTQDKLLAILHNLEPKSRNLGIYYSKTIEIVIISQTCPVDVRSLTSTCTYMGTLISNQGAVLRKLIVDVNSKKP